MVDALHFDFVVIGTGPGGEGADLLPNPDTQGRA